MFGVLVVKDSAGTVGFLTAFSGNLAGSNSHEYFVPPIYDMLRPGDLFRTEEAAISDLNRQIETLETDVRYRELLRTIRRNGNREPPGKSQPQKPGCESQKPPEKPDAGSTRTKIRRRL